MKELYLNSLYRLRKNALFYVVFGIIIAVGLLVNLFLYVQVQYLIRYYSQNQMSYEGYWSLNEIYLSAFSPTSLPMLLVPLFSIYFISADYRNDTFRNQILAGKTRKEIFFSSLCLCLSFYLLAVILSLVFGLLLGALIPEVSLTVTGSEFFFDLWVCFLIGIMINCFACFIISCFSNTAISIIVFLAIVMACNSIPILSGFNYLYFGNNNIISTYIYDEFLFPTQVTRAINGALNKAYIYAADGYSFFASASSVVEGRTFIILLKHFFMCALEICGCIFFGLRIFERKDLK